MQSLFFNYTGAIHNWYAFVSTTFNSDAKQSLRAHLKYGMVTFYITAQK